jgi:hypothetical protein
MCLIFKLYPPLTLQENIRTLKQSITQDNLSKGILSILPIQSLTNVALLKSAGDPRVLAMAVPALLDRLLFLVGQVGLEERALARTVTAFPGLLCYSVDKNLQARAPQEEHSFVLRTFVQELLELMQAWNHGSTGHEKARANRDVAWGLFKRRLVLSTKLKIALDEGFS